MVTFDHRDPGTPEEDWARCGALHRAPELDLAGVDRAVVFAAHPDDETLGAGGTVHRLARQGTEVRVVVATLGRTPTRTPPRSRRPSSRGCVTRSWPPRCGP